MDFIHPSLAEITEAHSRIQNYIHRTPILTSKSINEITGADIYFKCENLQKIGAFKIRGATNAVFQLKDNIKAVATHSSGNHAQAVAYAGKLRGLKAYIVMPENAPKVKVKAVKGYGAEVIFCEPNQKAREAALNKVVENTGAAFIHPYDNEKVICGQATASKELLEDAPRLDIVMTPVGGGGLLSGTSLTVNYLSKGTKVIAGEPAGADDAYRSFYSDQIFPSINPKTIADGLLTSLGQRNYSIIKEYVDSIICVDDQEIINAMQLIWERMKIVIEPSSAVPLAALIKNKADFDNKKVGIILSGGNVDLGKLPF
ncbi:pyridoxal-phosphate dependent enzyme [Chondrinema litorale]|uniref:pyridoxal-phosphate dependent enzyme n=1 Tax=Chondrinema litorale TaxID=2994555 RepID=UPI002542F2FF|nr:pyridoxal-phosphate dependent enzyme [Chondrinema litorale]UZR95435.1 pyridoxal-phosphate dependent enzyme [Chondrinema litorale]